MCKVADQSAGMLDVNSGLPEYLDLLGIQDAGKAKKTNISYILQYILKS